MDKLLLLLIICLFNLQTFSAEVAGISDDVTLDYGLIDEIFDQDTKEDWHERRNSSTSADSSNDGSSEAVVNEAAIGPHFSVLPCLFFFCLFRHFLVID